MKSKEFEFEDGSIAKFLIDDFGLTLTIILQAVHLGKELKLTSTQTVLDPNKTLELFRWLKEECDDTTIQEV